jgi:hypothetical protein
MTIEEMFKKWLEEKPMAKILVKENAQMGYILEFAEYYHKQEIFKMKSPYKEKRKLLTDFYMWMVENEYSHNIRIRVETKAELFLRECDMESEQLECKCAVNPDTIKKEIDRNKCFECGLPIVAL